MPSDTDTAVALSPFLGESPSLIARVAAALSQPDAILYFKTNVYFKDIHHQISADPANDTLDHAVEVWQGAGAHQKREIVGPKRRAQHSSGRACDHPRALRDAQ